MNKTIKLAIAGLVAMSLTLPTGVAPASAKPSGVSNSSKMLVMKLYYGEQQAAQRSFAAIDAYIVKNNYPGMYGAKLTMQCLALYEKQTGSSYGPTFADLSTLMPDPSWTIPTGLPQNNLSGRKPKGTTYVFAGTRSGDQAYMHVTILNGKAYFYFWVCGS
jgi:hypothetical protein